MSVKLTKAGLQEVAPGEPGEPGIVEMEDAFDLLRIWHDRLASVDDDVTLGDLFGVLAPLEGVDLLTLLTGVSVPPLIEEAKKDRIPEDDDDLVEYLEVVNKVDLTTYVPDPDTPDVPPRELNRDEEVEHDLVQEALEDLTGEKRPRKVYDATEDDPITGVAKIRRMVSGQRFGKWTGPYHIHREFQGWGRQSEPYEGFFAEHPDIDPAEFRGAFGLSLTPVQNLLHYSLRYNAAAQFKDSRTGGNVLLESSLTITVGEFINAIFEELGAYGTPEERDEFVEWTTERLDDVLNRD